MSHGLTICDHGVEQHVPCAACEERHAVFSARLAEAYRLNCPRCGAAINKAQAEAELAAARALLAECVEALSAYHTMYMAPIGGHPQPGALIERARAALAPAASGAEES